MVPALDPPDLHFVLREEVADDLAAIDALTREAFRIHPLSRQTEHLIVRGLRDAGALPLSLVATIDGELIGHAAFSPVQIDGVTGVWWGLGPISVAPQRQRSGVGSALVRSGLRRLADRGVAGCVVLGDPAYYARFGFGPSGGLLYPGPPADRFMAWAADDRLPSGQVRYHAAFEANA